MRMNHQLATTYEKLDSLVRQDATDERRRAAVSQLRACGQVFPPSDIAEALSAVAAVLERPGVVLIGSVAFGVYCSIKGVLDLPCELVSSKDVDIFCLPDDVPMASPPLRTPQNDFMREIGINRVKVDFTVPETVEQEALGGAPHWVYVQALSSYAHILPGYVRFIAEETLDATLSLEDGLKVKVPHPVRYAIHKFALSCVRKEVLKSDRDRGQAEVVLNVFAEDYAHRADIISDFLTYQDGLFIAPVQQALARSMPNLTEPSRNLLYRGIELAMKKLG